MRQKKATISPAEMATRELRHRLTPIFTDAEKAFRESVFHLCSSVARKSLLQNNRLPLRHHQDLLLDAMLARSGEEPLRRFMHRLKTEAKGSIVHWDQCLSAEFEKCLHVFLGIPLHFAAGSRFVS